MCTGEVLTQLDPLEAIWSPIKPAVCVLPISSDSQCITLLPFSAFTICHWLQPAQLHNIAEPALRVKRGQLSC